MIFKMKLKVDYKKQRGLKISSFVLCEKPQAFGCESPPCLGENFVGLVVPANAIRSANSSDLPVT